MPENPTPLILDLDDVQIPEVTVDELPPDPDDVQDDHHEQATDEATGQDADL